MATTLPKEVKTILKTLEDKGYSAYAVGGCVRDLLRGEEPSDWDIATSATPEEIQNLFENTFYENAFGTVTVKTAARKKSLREIEITTYRTESAYSDKRHPDSVSFAKTIQEDLARRDFTVNAMSLGQDGALVDPYGGQEDLKGKVMRTVGKAEDRFAEDALRMMRAVRLATALGFNIEKETQKAIAKNAKLLDAIAKERVRDELIKILDSKKAADGIVLLKKLGLLRYVLPYLQKGVEVGQNKHHIYTVFEHNVYALDWAAKHDYPFHVKVASLLHDVGKPQTKQGEGYNSTFYGHEIVGARIAKKELARLHFSGDLIEKVWLLVRYHLFYYNVGEVTEKSVRRLLAKVGAENMDDLLKVRIADRKGSGVPKAVPYRLRHFQYMVEKVQKDPISVKMLKVGGGDVMRELGIGPGPKVGQILAILMDEVLEDPARNTGARLGARIKELAELSDSELQRRRAESEAKQKELDEEVREELRGKYYVKE